MNKIYLIFDYFKETFNVNKNNKILYKPQIMFIAFKSILIIMSGVFIYYLIGNKQFINSMIYGFNQFDEVMANIFITAIAGVLLILLLIIITRIIEAGLYNMYKKSVIGEEININDFWEGVGKYFFKFIFGDLLVSFCWVIAFIPYIIFGLLTFSLGFTLIPIAVSIFLTMWKVSLVVNDSKIIDAFKDSIKFAEKNFAPLLVLQIIHWSFVNKSGGSSFSNFSDLDENSDKLPEILPGGYEAIDRILNNIKLGVVIIVPVITIAYIFASFVSMIFEVFFSLSLFVTYKNKFIVEESISSQEVIL